MLTDYQEIVGFLRVHKLASINTQVYFIFSASYCRMQQLASHLSCILPLEVMGDQFLIDKYFQIYTAHSRLRWYGLHSNFDTVLYLCVLKISSVNDPFFMQIPSVPDANVHTMKVVRRKKLILERLLFAPVDAVSGDSGSGSAASLLCGQPANAPSKYDF